MKIKALKYFHGSLNGFEVVSIEKDSILDVDEVTAKIFINAGFCQPVTQKQKSSAD
jgi:hypothetical protein